MLPRFCRALLLLWLSVAAVPTRAQRASGGPPTQDPFARHEVAGATRGIGNYRSHSYQKGILTINSTSGGTLRIRPWAEGVVRVEYFPAGQPVGEIPSVSVVQKQPWPPERLSCNPGCDGPPPAATLAQYGKDFCAGIRVFSTKITWQAACPGEIVIQKNPLRVSYQRGPETMVAEAAGPFQELATGQETPGGMGVSFRLAPDEHLYGTGSRALPLDRRGRRLRLYNEAHYGYQNGEATLNVSLPTVMSSRGYMLFFDNHAPGTLDLGATEKNTLEYRGEGLENLAYFIVAGQSYAEILDRYTTLTGKQPLPPRWGLGLIQSRFGYQSEQEMYQVAGRMRRAGFPLDALVLDLYWFGGTTRQGDFSWQPRQFPDPKRMMRRLDSAGVKTILISEPYVMRASRNDSLVRAQQLVGRDFKGQPYTVESFWAGPATLLDMDRPTTRQWLWQQYNRLKQDGVGGWWSDLGEPENQPADMLYDGGPTRRIHNAYGQAWASILREGYAQQYPQQRLFNLARSGWAGMQRNSVFPWSGDVSRSWSGLQAQVPIMLSMGLGGVGYMHSDAGGFAGSNMDAELYTRWLQLASLGPIFRPHGVVAPEPYHYPEPYQNSVRDYARLRYQLLPYLYTLAWENAQTGTPLTRPMNYGETRLDPQSVLALLSPEEEAQNRDSALPLVSTWNWNTKAYTAWGAERLANRQAKAFAANNSPALLNVNDQYLLGPNLLVAPVVQPGQRRRNVVLPPGRWLDFYSQQAFEGNQTIGLPAPLARVPLLVRAGAFLPMAPYVTSTARYRTDTLNVRYYADPTVLESSFTLYDDDGKSAGAIRSGTFDLISFTGKLTAGLAKIQIRLSGNGYPTAPAWRTINLEIPRVKAAPTAVIIDEQTVPATDWQYEPAHQMLRLRCLLSEKDVTILVRSLQLDATVTSTATPEVLTLEAPGSRQFSTGTELRYTLHTPGSYPLLIRNSRGETVRTFPQPLQSAGLHTVAWNGTDAQGRSLPNGVYTAEMHGQHQRLVLLRE
ncbi:TIM-barrel domain-containing protein [Hymenobacter lucidus]|uniref:DUF5110 domain-containing protein n=1 Tax=Hymenobacter lucidus TaxID=2880930 RepID=A0ABS8APG8_9BACT|nr:TIM-barrel domain-containing protein [Hymenobacter lucidus]MCB2407636.1 DUF5110 domain-containing protein [Hymenobacter lucidus]